MPRMTFIYPDGTEVRCSLDGELFTLGRAEDNSIQLADARVSSHHAVLNRAAGGDFMLTDAGATNPTRVNGRPIQQHALHHGDTILFGDVFATYENDRAAFDPRHPRRTAATPQLPPAVGKGCFASLLALGLAATGGLIKYLT